jgi:hypothetical protein
MGLSRFTQPVKELDVGRLIQQFTELEKDSAQLRPVIAERIAAKAKLVEDQFSDLSETLFPVDEEAHPVGEYTHGQQATQQRPHQHPW